MPTKNSFHSYETLLGYLLSTASALMDRQFIRHLKPLGLTLPAWRVLAVLSRERELSINRLARKALLNQPTLTAIVDRLAAKDLVKRRGSPVDGRVFLVSLSGPGKKLVARLVAEAERIEARDLEGYSPEEKRVLKTGLQTLIARLEQNHD
jgi:DNA-binding MarR family transcriptional regulator